MDGNTKKLLIVGGVGAALLGFWYFFFGPGAAQVAPVPGSVPASGGSSAPDESAPVNYVPPEQQTSTTICQTDINAIELSGGFATAVFSGPISSMQYAVDGKAAGSMMPVTQSVNLSALGLAPGPHMISMTPYCMLGGQWVAGGSSEINFTE